MRPAGMAFAAKASLPMTESKERFVHFVLDLNAARSCWIAASFSRGMLVTWDTVSSWMPRNVITVVGEQERNCLRIHVFYS